MMICISLQFVFMQCLIIYKDLYFVLIVIMYFAELPRCFIDIRLWCQCYSHGFQQLIAYNKGRKHQLWLVKLKLESSHDGSKYLEEYLTGAFYVLEFYLNTHPIP
jgi:hypothetical protein